MDSPPTPSPRKSNFIPSDPRHGRTLFAIGGKDAFIVLKRRYQFNWTAFGNFYFLETEGVVVAEDQPASAGAETCEASAG